MKFSVLEPFVQTRRVIKIFQKVRSDYNFERFDWFIDWFTPRALTNQMKSVVFSANQTEKKQNRDVRVLRGFPAPYTCCPSFLLDETGAVTL